jgi:hypothetical protein
MDQRRASRLFRSRIFCGRRLRGRPGTVLVFGLILGRLGWLVISVRPGGQLGERSARIARRPPLRGT